MVVPVLLAGALVAVQVALAVPPTVSFTPTAPPGGCGQFTFTSNANDGDGDITATEWDFESDGTFDDTGSPVFRTFSTAGPRNVTLRVTDGIEGDGVVDVVSANQTVDVQNDGVPNAAVNTPAPVGIGDPVAFSGAGSSDGGPIAEYRWDLDNSGSDFETSTGTSAAAPTQSYATPGTKTVRLQVTDSCGATDVASGSVLVQNSAPNAAFTIGPNPANPGATVTFNAATSTDPDPPDQAGLTYEWSLDGDTVFNEAAEGETNAQQVTKAYPTARTLVVRLRVTDPHGLSNTEAIALTINRAPVAAFAFNPEAPVINEPVTFTPTGSFDFENSIETYEWDLDGNMSFETTGQNPPPKTYDTAGAVSVGLRVTDEDGGVTVVRRTVNVGLTRPTARLAFSPANPLPGQRVTLVSTSTPSATPGPPQLTATQWDLNYAPNAEFTADAAGPSLATSFTTAGPKTVAVKVTQTGGGFDIAYVTIVVNAPPRAAFDVAPDDPVAGDQLTFASTSGDPDGPLAKQEWDLDGDNQFDDATGAVASMRNVKKGTHSIRLRVTDSRGATAVAQRPVTVAAKPLKRLPAIGKTFYFTPTKWGIKLSRLVVKVPSRTTVRVKCKGTGCPRGTFKKRSKSKAARLRFDRVRGSLRAGAKIMVISTRPGYFGQHVTYTVRGKFQQPSKRERCFRISPAKLQRCPSS